MNASTRSLTPAARRRRTRQAALAPLATAALALALASCAAVPDLGLEPSWTLLGHESDVVSVAVSADGARVYSADVTGKIRDWSLATGEPISVITPVDGADRVVLAARGDWALAARSNLVLAIDMHKRELVTTFETGPRTAATRVADVTVSPQGGIVLVADRDGGVSAWNLRTSPPTRLARGGLSGGSGPRPSALSANGRLALIGSPAAPDVEVWDLLGGRRIGVLAGESPGTRLVAFMPNGRRAAIVGTDDVIRIWEPATGEPMAALHSDGALGISAIAFSAAGDLVITGHNDGAIVFWSEATGEAEGKIAAHAGWIQSLAVSADGRTLVSGGPDDTVKVWDIGATAGLDLQSVNP